MSDIEVKRRYTSLHNTQGIAELYYDITFSLDAAPRGENEVEFHLSQSELISETVTVVGKDSKARKVKRPKVVSVSNSCTGFNDWPRSLAEQPDKKGVKDVAWRYWTLYPTRTALLSPQTLTIKWKPGYATDVRTEQIEIGSFNQLNTDSSIELALGSPQLLALINSPDVVAAPDPPGAATAEAQVAAILEHICSRLEGGLGPVWRLDGALPMFAVDSKSAPVPLCEADPEALLSPGHVEEAWAQAISEYLVGTPYLGPGGDYIGGDDTTVFANAIGAEPSVPIIYACQHLATMAAISRGFDGAASFPFDAQSADNVLLWDPPGRVHNPPAAAGGSSAAAGIDSGAVRPGSVYIVPPKHRHIAFVLRTLRSKRVQLIDTGAMWPAEGNPNNTVRAHPISGNYDTHDMTGIRADRNLYAIGSLGLAPRLAEAIKRLRASRPMGLARLIVLDRMTQSGKDVPSAGTDLPNRLRYVSPWLPMWDRSDLKRNYPISRYLWSLRNHPFRDAFEARWLIDIPQGNLYRDMARSRNIAPNPKSPGGRQWPVLDIGTTVEGFVRTVGKVIYTTGTGAQNCDTPGCPNCNRRPENWHIWSDPTSKVKSEREGLVFDRPEVVHAADNAPGLALRRAGLQPGNSPTNLIVPTTTPAYLLP
jgi:hypothetical protein